MKRGVFMKKINVQDQSLFMDFYEKIFHQIPVEFYDEKSIYYNKMQDSLIRELYLILFYKQFKQGLTDDTKEKIYYVTFSIKDLVMLLRVSKSKIENTILRLEILNLLQIKSKYKDNYEVYLFRPEPTPKSMIEYYEREIDEIKSKIQGCLRFLENSTNVEDKIRVKNDYTDLSVQLNEIYEHYIKELKGETKEP